MRNTFVKTLIELARKDERIYLLTGDLGFMVMEPFRDEFKNRFINAGVQEAHMVGMASGLALSGKIPYVYSIVPFLIYRSLEQIRNDVCYHRLKVRIVGVGSGYSYGIMGSTHHALEDIGVMKSLPNMSVVCPGDPVEVEGIVRESVDYQGPLYLRLAKAGEPILHSKPGSFKIGKANVLRDGKDLTLIATGNMLETAVVVAQKLKEESLEARVVSMHTVSPIDRDEIIHSAQETRFIFTLEEHMYDNGLSSSVALVLAESRCRDFVFNAFATKKGFAEMVGRQDFLRKVEKLDPESVAAKILELKRGKSL